MSDAAVIPVPAAPVAPVAPAGMPKLNVAAELDPAFVTVGVAPAERGVTVPTAMVAALPGEPLLPLFPGGNVRLRIGARDVPVIVAAAVPCATVPIEKTGLAPGLPAVPGLPCGPGKVNVVQML